MARDPVILSLLASAVAGSVFSPQLAMALAWFGGLVVGVALSAVETRQTPKELRDRAFTMYVGSGKYGTPFQHDSRLVGTLTLAFLCGVAAVLGILLRTGIGHIL